MNKTLKKPLLTASLLILGTVGAVALAQVNVKSDLSNAVQNIQKVYFSPDGLRNADPSKNILMEAHNGLVKIDGKVLLEKDGDLNVLEPAGGYTSVIQGENNRAEGQDTLMIGGRRSIVASGTHSASIIGGHFNSIESGVQNGAIIG